MNAVLLQCSKMYIQPNTIIKRKFATSEYGIMHGSLNAQSYVGMLNKHNRLRCYIYLEENRTILQKCDAITSKKLQMCIIDKKAAFDLC